MAAAACGVWGGGYVPLHVGAAVERRDEAEEVSGSEQQGPQNSRASLRTNPKADSDIKQMSGRRQVQTKSCQLRHDGLAAEDKA
jgi:hypothetical protein